MSWTSPRTWVAGEDLTAALLNVHLRDNLKAIGDAWTAYTPTLGGWTLGNGSFAGSAYLAAGKLIHARMWYTVGSTDTKAGVPTFTLPVAALYPNVYGIGTGALYDSSVPARGFRHVFLASTTTIQFTTEADVRLSPTVPWTWATGDMMIANVTYEAA